METEAQKPENQVPKQFEGKSLEEIIEMYRELEREKSRLGNEVGTLRKALKEAMNVATETKAVKLREQLAENIGEDAAKNLTEYVGQIESELSELRLKMELLKRHPDAFQIVQAPEFSSWVEANPERKKLYEAADSGDLEAANQLLSSYKLEKRSAAIRAASGERGAPAPTPSKPTFSRAQLRQLMLENPSEYKRLLPEIRAAYAEGRVTP